MNFEKQAIADFLEQVESEGNPRIFTKLDDGLKMIPSLPKAWEPLREATKSPRASLVKLWQGAGAKLPRTLKMLERKLAGFAILTTKSERPSLLYLFDEGRDLMARRGYWPAETLPAVSKNLSVDLTPFYWLHDGWVNLFSGDGGLLPSRLWKKIGQASGVKGLLEVYSKGGQSIGFDLDNKPSKPFAIDADDDEVEAVRDFWKELDERIAAGLKSFPDAS